MNFADYQKLIQKQAHAASSRYNVEYEDMEAQGYLIYCECVQNYDITKSSFTTYLYINLAGRLADYAITTIRQRGMNLHDMLNHGVDEDDIIDENNCILLSVSDSHVTMDDILDHARDNLSHDSYTIFEWILNRTWERKGRRKPSIHSAMEVFGWKRTKMQRCWDECRAFWISEGAAFCC